MFFNSSGRVERAYGWIVTGFYSIESLGGAPESAYFILKHSGWISFLVLVD